MVTTKELVKIHVQASGPVSFPNIQDYVAIQGGYDIPNYEIVNAINELVQEKEIGIYEDGVTFAAWGG